MKNLMELECAPGENNSCSFIAIENKQTVKITSTAKMLKILIFHFLVNLLRVTKRFVIFTTSYIISRII